MTSDPIDQAFATNGAEGHFMAMTGGTRECICPECTTTRSSPPMTRVELITRVAAQMGVPVSTKEYKPPTVPTVEEFRNKWAAIKAGRKRQSVTRW